MRESKKKIQKLFKGHKFKTENKKKEKHRGSESQYEELKQNRRGNSY